MRVRQTKDYKTIARLNKHVQELHASLYPDFFKKHEYTSVKSFFKQIMDNPNFIFLLLEDDNQAIGYAWIELLQYPENPFTYRYQSVYVHQISIKESARHKGYGTKLMDVIYQIGRKHDASKIELDYWAENGVAKNFYDKLGFVKNREFVYKNI